MKYQKGQSGNPKGRPRGSRNQKTVLAEQLLAADAKEIVATLIRLAKAGDSTALKLTVERLLPLRRNKPVPLPELEAVLAEGKPEAECWQILLAAVTGGQLTIDEAEGMARLLDMADQAKAVNAFQEEVLELIRELPSEHAARFMARLRERRDARALAARRLSASQNG